jgi:hypothetical protein
VPFGWGKKDEAGPLDTSALDAFGRALPGDLGSMGPASGWTEKSTKDLLGRELPIFTAFIAEHARSSVAGGALRFLLPSTNPSLVSWNGRGGWHSDWPSVQPGVAFATDWMGRLFLFLPKVKVRNGEPALGLLVPTTGESIVLDYSFGEFLGQAMATDWRNLVEADRLDEWRAAGNATPAFDQAVAPKQPLILGGSDEISEMELTPLVVAVSFGGQVWEQVKDLPPGTTISGASIE